MFFQSNIKLLRLRKNKTQDDLGSDLGLTRSTINSYENGIIRNPTVDALLSFSNYFKISIDTLLRVDLSNLRESQLSELEHGRDVYIRGSKLRVLATTVDPENRENIEVVSHKARAGYKSGYADPEFIRRLPTFQLPILFNDRKYRMFQISGDSMLPIPDKSWVIAEYLENWFDIKDGQAYVILTMDDGIVFKIAENHLKKKRTLLLRSLNADYTAYEVHVNDIKEVWKFCNFISDELPNDVLPKSELINKLQFLSNQIGEISQGLQS